MSDVTPRFFYGYWSELGYIEVGQRVEDSYDEASSIEHRMAKAYGATYGCPPRHWDWRVLHVRV
jgi:hypothetical protein